MNYHHHRNYQWEGSGLPQILESRSRSVQLLKTPFTPCIHACIHAGAHTLNTNTYNHHVMERDLGFFPSNFYNYLNILEPNNGPASLLV